MSRPIDESHLHKPYEGCHLDCPEPHMTVEEAREALLEEHREWLATFLTPESLRSEAERLRERADKCERQAQELENNPEKSR